METHADKMPPARHAQHHALQLTLHTNITVGFCSTQTKRNSTLKPLDAQLLPGQHVFVQVAERDAVLRHTGAVQSKIGSLEREHLTISH